LDVSTRQGVIDSLQGQGLFTDQARRDQMMSQPLATLAPQAREGFGRFLARHRLDGSRSVECLDDSTRRYIVEELKQTDLLADPERLEELPHQRLVEVDRDLAAQVREELMNRLRADLDAKTMEELPAETRREVHRVLDRRNYFVDQEKVGWYERKTLAQLPVEAMHGLEERLGQVRLEELAETHFQNLAPEIQDSLEDLFDDEGLLTARAERLRLTQTGRLADLPDEAREAVVRHLGRRWLVEIRGQRPTALPDDERELVWVYLRDQGLFADEFKEELFQYQRLDEFDTEVQQAVEEALDEQLSGRLETRAIGDLSPEVRTVIREHLQRADYFVDKERLRRAVGSPLQDLLAELRQAVETALGRRLLADVDAAPVAELPSEIQNTLWRYLDEIGYFVDEKKRNQVLDRRLADLKSGQYEQVVRDLAEHLAGEVRDRPVSTLDEGLRQGLREAVEVQGFFESEEERARMLSQPLAELRREDLRALAFKFGQGRLRALADRSLNDLPGADRELALSHLQAHDWFLDQSRLDRLRNQRVADLDAETRQELVDRLRQQHVTHLGQQRLATLKREQRHAVRSFLQEQGLALDEEQMRPLRDRTVHDLDRDAYDDLLRDLGSQVVAEWRPTRFQDMGRDPQALLGAYLGRRIMARIERRVLLHTISRLWVDYLTDIEDVRRGIGLEAYGQRDPLVEYKRRAVELFEELGRNIRRTAVRTLFRQQPEPLATQ
jgi:hypothetical protein